MTAKRKSSIGAALLATALLVAGCGGINHTQSISPASFFLPGLLKVDPQPQPPMPSDAPTPEPAPPVAPADAATKLASLSY